jgi:hypothetical protein
MTEHMKEEADRIRKEMENQGYILSEPEYEIILGHTTRKLEVNGKDEEYLQYLLPDEIKDYFFRITVNAASLLMMA